LTYETPNPFHHPPPHLLPHTTAATPHLRAPAGPGQLHGSAVQVPDLQRDVVGGYSLHSFTKLILNKFSIKMEDQTIGEQLVRTKFNPSAYTVVDLIKQKTAELINLCEQLKAKDERLASIAQTEYENAAMWAVKAATA